MSNHLAVGGDDATGADGARYDLLVLGGTVVEPDRAEDLDVAVSGERIAAVGPSGTLGTNAARVLRADQHLVIPGGVDPHVHYAMDFDGVISEGPEYSAACAWGGTTSVVDFAFYEPPGSVLDSIEAKKRDFAGRMAVDYGLHVILTKEFSFDAVEEIADVIAGGIPTVKTMMTYGFMSDDGQRFGAMREVGRHGGMSVVHAEDDAIARWLTAEYIRAGKVHGAYICETRGPIVEEAAVRRAMFLAERANSPLYVLHMAAADGINALAEGRARGLPFYGETLPTYLSFTQDDLWDDAVIEEGGRSYRGRGLLINNFPTPKFAADRIECWSALADGRVATVGTDHAPATVRERFEVMGSTIDSDLQAGQVSAELRLALVHSEGVVKGRLSPQRWVEACCTNPAKLMGLWPAKGRLAAGADADIVIFDPRTRWTVDWRELHMSVPYSCWDGWELTGKTVTTILRGTVLVDDGTWVGSKTGGRFQPRVLPAEVRAPDLRFTAQAANGR